MHEPEQITIMWRTKEHDTEYNFHITLNNKINIYTLCLQTTKKKLNLFAMHETSNSNNNNNNVKFEGNDKTNQKKIYIMELGHMKRKALFTQQSNVFFRMQNSGDKKNAL